MNVFRFALLISALLDSTYPATATDLIPPPKLLRLGIVDDSGSMKDERIATVREEWLKLARQLPPSVEQPIVLVTFGSDAASPQTFVDLSTFEEAIGLLKAGSGGTNIAAGLREGIAYLNAQPAAQDVWVFLYSDGEDPNQVGILAAEAQLDAIFAKRQEQGLPQTVFLKRWGNANADLLARIQGHGRAKVLDAGELAIRPITFQPQVDLIGVEWNPTDPLKLDVEFAPRLTVLGTVDDLHLPTLKLAVDIEAATGETTVDVEPNGLPVTRKVTIPVSAEARRIGKLNLPFVLTPPADIEADSAKVLPLLAANQIDLPVDLPEDRFTYRTVVTTTAQVGTWNDTQAKRFRTPLHLQFEVTCREGEVGSPGDIELSPATGTVIVSGPQSVTLPASGKVAVDLVVETAVENPTEQPAAWRAAYAITAQPVRTAKHVTFEPAELAINGDAPIPPPLVTPITAKVMRVSAAEWVDLARGAARFQVEVEFQVAGPIAPHSQINLVTTGSVLQVDIKPATLQTGTQRVTLDVTAIVPPGPQTQSIESKITPPASDGVIRYQAGPAFQYTVTGPTALQLGIASRGRPVSTLRASIADNDREAHVQFEPIVLGLKPSPLVHDLDVRLDSQVDPLKFNAPGPYRVFRRGQITVPTTMPESLPFFRDTVLAGSVDIKPVHGNTAVSSGTVPFIVVVAAPFKRLLWQLALALSSILAVIVVLRLYLTLRKSD